MNGTTMHNVQNENREERIHMMRDFIAPHKPEHHLHGYRHPIPPHERRDMIYVEFDQQGEEVLGEMFGSEEEADIAINILHCAPPETQLLVLQLLKVNGVNLKARFPKAHMQSINARWGAPILGEEVYEKYINAYGEDGECYVEVLESSPYEIAVISRIIAYMQDKRGE